MRGIELAPRAKLNAEALPNGDALVRYFEQRVPTGDCMRNMLANDLIGFFSHADEYNRAAAYDYVMWLYNDVPGRGTGIWGSHEAVGSWLSGATET